MLTLPFEQDTQLLDSFGSELNIAVVGASGGLGNAFVKSLEHCQNVKNVILLSRGTPVTTNSSSRVLFLDLEKEETIKAAANRVQNTVGSLDLVIVATGILHNGSKIQPERSWKSIDVEALDHVFRINTFGPALIARHFLPLLRLKRKSVFAALSARVGSIGDNRLGGWHSYRASKAALNMLVRTLSVELSRKNPHAICVALHPGTVDTALSKPFQSSVPKDRLKTPQVSAHQLLGVIDSLSPEDTGFLFGWDGERIAF